MSRKWNTSDIIYHIYPRSFKDSNNDGVGDLKGILEKLDYLNDGTDNSLGINSIWLSPVYKSPMKDYGYDISDYYNIDPIFGTMEDFENLVEESHKRGINVIMDYVPNHTSSEHPWFLESRSSKENSKRDWYIWADPKSDGIPPNNWLSIFGGSAWEFDKQTNQYYLHTFVKSQPDLNWRNPDVVKEMLNVLRFWIEKGVDGFRVDAIYFLFKDKRLLDEPENPEYIIGKHDPFDQLRHIYTFEQPELFKTMKKFVEILEEYKNKFMVAEVYIPLPKLIKIYHEVSHKWFAPFNFHLISLPWKAEEHKNFIDEYDKSVGELYIPTYVLGNHDRARLASRIGDSQIRIAAILLLTLRGIPFIYYGEEMGMKDVKIPEEKVLDPVEKNLPGLGLGRDPERTPMQWNGSEHAGFSRAEPWLPLSEDYKTNNIELYNNDPKSILSLYKKIIHFRKKSKALTWGKYLSLNINDDDVFVYSRIYEDETILIVLNYTNDEKLITLPFKEGTIILNTFLDKSSGEKINLKALELQPNEGLIINIIS